MVTCEHEGGKEDGADDRQRNSEGQCWRLVVRNCGGHRGVRNGFGRVYRSGGYGHRVLIRCIGGRWRRYCSWARWRVVVASVSARRLSGASIGCRRSRLGICYGHTSDTRPRQATEEILTAEIENRRVRHLPRIICHLEVVSRLRLCLGCCPVSKLRNT